MVAERTGNESRRFLVVMVLAVAGVACGLVARREYWPTPAESLHDFYVDEAAEDMLMDPLILAGEPVVPLVLAALPNPQMLRRRYAIAFIGNGGYLAALPALRRVLAGDAEDPLFRGDALEAICRIDAHEGRERAPAYVTRDDYLGSMAKSLLEQGCAAERRTYQDALAGRHD